VQSILELSNEKDSLNAEINDTNARIDELVKENNTKSGSIAELIGERDGLLREIEMEEDETRGKLQEMQNSFAQIV
jgi:uncharacterized coiled-coil DUF342 family protein